MTQRENARKQALHYLKAAKHPTVDDIWNGSGPNWGKKRYAGFGNRQGFEFWYRGYRAWRGE